jgi:hypothetical protein
MRTADLSVLGTGADVSSRSEGLLALGVAWQLNVRMRPFRSSAALYVRM